MKLTVYRDSSIFSDLKAEWNDLLHQSTSDTIFCTWEWQSTWWNTYQAGDLLVERGVERAQVVAEGQVQQTRLTRNSAFLQGQYTASLTSLDNLRLTLIKEAPLFTIIEPVAMPLQKTVTKPRGLQAGLTLGLLLGLLVVFVRETYKSIMRQD